MGTLMLPVFYTIVPAGAAVGSSLLAVRCRPSDQFQSCVQHIAAGIIFAAVATQLLPPVQRQPPLIAITGFLAGIAVMMLVRHFTQQLELSRDATQTAGLIAVSATDVLIDGLVLGATFTLGTKQGSLLTLALTVGLVFLGLSITAALEQGGATQCRIVVTTLAIALVLPIGTGLGTAFFQRVSEAALAAILAFGSVVLMYLVTEELLVRAHRVQRTTWAMPMFFVGFLVFVVLANLMS